MSHRPAPLLKPFAIEERAFSSGPQLSTPRERLTGMSDRLDREECLSYFQLLPLASRFFFPVAVRSIVPL